MSNWLRKKWDKAVLSNYNWKKKYCSHVYHYLFEMTDDERRQRFKEHKAWLKENQHRL